MGVEWPGLDCLTTDLNHCHLDYKGENGYEKEQEVVEEALEDIELSILNLSGVDLVEKLHENEHLEDHCIVKKFLTHVGYSFSLEYLPIGWENCTLLFNSLTSWCRVRPRCNWSLAVEGAGVLVECSRSKVGRRNIEIAPVIECLVGKVKF